MTALAAARGPAALVARRGLEWWRLGPRGATCGSGVGGVGGAARSKTSTRGLGATTQVQSLVGSLNQLQSLTEAQEAGNFEIYCGSWSHSEVSSWFFEPVSSLN